MKSQIRSSCLPQALNRSGTGQAGATSIKNEIPRFARNDRTTTSLRGAPEAPIKRPMSREKRIPITRKSFFDILAAMAIRTIELEALPVAVAIADIFKMWLSVFAVPSTHQDQGFRFSSHPQNRAEGEVSVQIRHAALCSVLRVTPVRTGGPRKSSVPCRVQRGLQSPWFDHQLLGAHGLGSKAQDNAQPLGGRAG